jgi:hypothetical protein
MLRLPAARRTDAEGRHPTAPPIEKIVVVTKKTPLADLVARLNSPGQARFYLEQNGVSFAEYERGDARYRQALAAIAHRLPRTLKHQFVDRDFLPTFQFGERDLVITVGPDGLVINTAKYLTTQPILAINPDPDRIDGVLIPFGVDDLATWLPRAVQGTAPVTGITMAKATLNDGQVLYAVNDLFIGARTHVSARYRLELAGRAEQQSSSGLIVATGAGCTGWLRAITTGAGQIARYFDENAGPPPGPAALALGWDAARLWFAVREPFPSKSSQAELVVGQLGPGEELVITSQMPDYGVIFSDGIESDYLEFNSGAVARVGLAGRQARLIVRG